MKIIKKIMVCMIVLTLAVSCIDCKRVNEESKSTSTEKLNVAELFSSEEEIALRERYQFQKITYKGYNLDYTVKDSKGNSVDLSNYSFVAQDEDGYSVTVRVRETGEQYTYTLKTKDLTAPIVTYIRDYCNTMINEPIELVYPLYHDSVVSDEELKVQSTLYYGEEVIKVCTIQDFTFTPSQTGKYFLKTTVEDLQGNITTATYTYNVVDDKNFANKVIYFDEAEGVKCIKDRIAGSVSYNTDKEYCYGNEKGSTKITLNHDDNNSHVNPRFALNYPLIDLTGYNEIYFWVYNASDFRLGFFFNMTSAHIEIEQGQWTQFVIPVEKLIDLYTTNGNQFDLRDITGLQFFFHSIETNEQILDGACVYLSAIYAR